MPNAASMRAAALEWARGEIGNSDPEAYFRDAAPTYGSKWKGKQWCQIFCLAAHRAAGITALEWVDNAGIYGDLPRTDDPQPADVVIFPYAKDWQKGRKTIWHGALFSSREGDTVCTIDGNTSGGVVRACERDLKRYQAAPLKPYFVNVQPWIDAVATPDTDPAPPPYLPVRTLCKGMKGEDVRQWQLLLQREIQGALPRYGADGHFGDETESWTVALQMRLAGDAMPVMWGVVDEATRRLLK